MGLIDCPIHVSEEFFGDPGCGHLPVRVASVQHRLHPREPVFGEPFVAGEQDPTDPI
jgi:hypothetical protein